MFKATIAGEMLIQGDYDILKQDDGGIIVKIGGGSASDGLLLFNTEKDQASGQPQPWLHLCNATVDVFESKEVVFSPSSIRVREGRARVVS